MDPFTERILERARERQKKLQEYTHEKGVPLKEASQKCNIQELKTSSEPNLVNSANKNDRKTVVSDSCLATKSSKFESLSKEINSGNEIRKFVRHNSTTRVSSDMKCSPQAHSKTLNIQKDNFNMEIKLTSSENVRVEVEIGEEEDSDGGSNSSSNSGACLREDAKNRLKRLGKLYAGGDEADISSPIHRSEPKFDKECVISEKPKVITSESSNIKSKRGGLKCLADLAENINQWEDDVTPKTGSSEKLNLPKIVKQQTEVKENRSPSKNIVNKNITITPIKECHKNDVAKATPKKLKWDKAVLDTLESQGFERSTSNSKLVFKYKNPQDNLKNEDRITSSIPEDAASDVPARNKSESVAKPKVFVPTSPSKSNIRGAAVANKAAIFESSPSRNAKDPALLSVAERKALFEKNKGTVLVPKAAFGMAAPVKQEPQSNTNNDLETSAETKVKKSVPNVRQKYTAPSPPSVAYTKSGSVKPKAPPPPAPVNANFVMGIKEVVVPKSSGIASVVSALLENKSTISQEEIQSSVRAQRQKEMDVLLNRFNRNKPNPQEHMEEDEQDATEITPMISEQTAKIVSKSPSAAASPIKERRSSGAKRYSKDDSPKVAASLENIKRIRVSPAKPGRLYPCLSDIEATTETETEPTNSPSPDTSLESDSANTSFGRDILQAVCKNTTPQKRAIYDDSTASDISDPLDDMDDYLDEALAHGRNSDSSVGPTPPKQGRKTPPPPSKATQPSHSFQYKSYTPDKENRKPIENSNDMPTHIMDGENVLPLTHTVSFYRKQQTQISTPVRQITRQPMPSTIDEDSESKTDHNQIVHQKILDLMEEVNKQQMVISQTSQALNLCNSTPEFMGSTEQVEAEKLLLVATHRRQAALHEVQRLKVEGTLQPQGQHAQNVPLEKGTLTISDICLPLKREYVRVLCAAGGKGHHVVCLIKSGEQVVPTQLVSTVVTNTKNPETKLIIPGSVVLQNIYSNFTVTFEVYCLQAQEEVLPHEVKYHINNKKSSSILTPKKSKQESRMIRPPKESPGGPQAVRSPTFALMGYVVFSIQAVNRKSWCLNKVPSLSPLEGSVEMKVNCELAVSVEHRGFLTTFEDISGFGAWHRRWYLLKGPLLSYWKYPDDEKKMPPIDTIDLKNCSTDNVKLVSREICARPNTILLERERPASRDDKDSLTMICKGDKTVIRALLSADTKEDRIEWCSKLNAALTALRMWGN